MGFLVVSRGVVEYGRGMLNHPVCREKQVLTTVYLPPHHIYRHVFLVYQAISRGVYLFEVRKKALDLHNEDVDVEPTKAVIKMQAVRRF